MNLLKFMLATAVLAATPAFAVAPNSTRPVIVDGNATALDKLRADKSRRDGALGLGRWLIAVGIPTLIGSAGLALWHFFERSTP